MATDDSLVKGRESRRNAGNLMSKLIEDEQGVDDFYKTAFGGFEEESGDEEFESDQQEDDGEDVVDSDFSLSETDEVIDDGEDEPKRKRQKVYIKPYRKPKDETQTKKPRTTTRKADAPRQEGTRKSTRSLTVERSEEHKKRQDEATERRRRHREKQQKSRLPQLRRLTQEELLAEAAITEEENIASLQDHQMLEASKKKTKLQKVTFKGPLVRTLSLSMPLMELAEPEEVEVAALNDTEDKPPPPRLPADSSKRCSRNFLIFTDAKSFPDAYFPVKKPKPAQRSFCPVTGLPARYRDPLTKLPYANSGAFRYIRERFVMQAKDLRERAAAEQRRQQKAQ